MSKSKGLSANGTVGANALEETNRSLQQIAAGLGFVVLQMSSLKEAKNPEKIRFLSKFGFDRNQIAAILDSTPNTVSKELSILKAAGRKQERDADKANG